MMEEKDSDVYVPKAFVKWAEFPKILEQANTDGVKFTLLTKTDGALLSVAGNAEGIEQMVAALAGNMWKTYEDEAANAFAADRFYFLFADCENGKLAITKIGHFLLCMCADNGVEPGMLRAKMAAFSTYLEGPLGLILSS